MNGGDSAFAAFVSISATQGSVPEEGVIASCSRRISTRVSLGSHAVSRSVHLGVTTVVS
jgi:hypothetical protein